MLTRPGYFLLEFQYFRLVFELQKAESAERSVEIK